MNKKTRVTQIERINLMLEATWHPPYKKFVACKTYDRIYKYALMNSIGKYVSVHQTIKGLKSHIRFLLSVN